MAHVIGYCGKHRLQYNADRNGQCPLCVEEGHLTIDLMPLRQMEADEREQEKARLREEKLKEREAYRKAHPRQSIFPFICPFCTSKSLTEGTCSRPDCRRKAGLTAHGMPKTVNFLCRFCKGITYQEDRVCTKYQCRKRGGKEYMYVLK